MTDFQGEAMKKDAIEVITTAKNTNLRLSRQEMLFFQNDINDLENNLLVIYPECRYQTILGFGGAITEATGVIWDKLNKEKRRQLLAAYFGNEGIGYTLCRSHIQSCDFCLSNYAYINENESLTSKLNFKRDEKYLIPIISEAAQIAGGNFKLISSPWSPPGFMKTNGVMNGGGKLKPECYRDWAYIIASYIKVYRNKGIPIYGITIQNEALDAQKWESCVMTAQEESIFVEQYLYPELVKMQLEDVAIYFWDQNKERILERTRQFMNNHQAGEIVKGVAFHWYAGDHFDALRMVHEQFPQLQLLFTEGCEPGYVDNPPWEHGEHYAHEMIGNLNNYMNGFIDWNLFLDANGGPTHIGNYCNAPIIVDTKEQALEFRNSYYYLGHFSKYIMPGAVRLGTSCYTTDLEHTSFLNPDGHIIVQVLNRTDNDKVCVLKYESMVAEAKVRAHSMNTYIFDAEG